MRESHAWLTSPDELFRFNTWLLLMKIQLYFLQNNSKNVLNVDFVS